MCGSLLISLKQVVFLWDGGLTSLGLTSTEGGTNVKKMFSNRGTNVDRGY